MVGTAYSYVMAQVTAQQAFEWALQHHQADRLREAEDIYRQILAQQPDHFGALHYLGVIAHQMGRHDVAVDLIRKAINLNPNYAEAYCNLGQALKDMGQMDEAIITFGQALAINPDLVETHNNLGIAFKDKAQLDAAVAAHRQALARKPDYFQAHSNLIIDMNYHPGFDTRAIGRELGRWNQQHAEPLKKFIQPHANDRDPERRLRIGYVSPDFRIHPVGLLFLPVLENHDRQCVEVFGYAQVSTPDAITERSRAGFDTWRNLVGLSNVQVADLIRQDGIDILVDLALHTADNRLLVFACKPAPVQVTWLGYPGSTGLKTIDYRLSDPYLDPPGMDESVYSEQTIRLPHSFWCYDPLEGREIPVNLLPALNSGVVTFGCLNNFCKINDQLLSLWAPVLRQVEGSRLLLLANEGDHRQRTIDRLGQEGIAPHRVEFVSRQSHRKYLELYSRIDLGLDSFPYNGHTTSLDSYWMGVPVVTLVGQSAVSRAGWCQLSNLGLRELAGQTPEQFVQIAVDLAKDLPRLKELRATLRQRMAASPLTDGPRFARNIESAYRQMWRKWTSASSTEPRATCPK